MERLLRQDFFFPEVKEPANLSIGTLVGQVSTICGSGWGADTYGCGRGGLQQCGSGVGCRCGLVVHSTLQGNTEVLVDPTQHWLLPVLLICILQGQTLLGLLFMLGPSEKAADFFPPL